MSKNCATRVRSFVFLAVFLVIGLIAMSRSAVAATSEGVVNHLVEWTFTSNKPYPDPFHDVTLDMLVTGPDGARQRVPAFWAGKMTWRVRYSSPQVGIHQWRLNCSDHANQELDGIAGTLSIKPYLGSEPLYQHGFVHVAADHRHFQYADGTPFFWLADTWWMGLCHRLQWPQDFQKLAADRKQKGFTVIQIVAGLYPDMHPFDPRGANEAGYPWEANYTSIRPEYFDAADRRLEYLAEQGFSPCIVGAWGYFIPWMGVEKMKQHWRYLIARYGALPVFWCAAGEANLPWYLAPGFPYDDRKQITEWTEVMRYIRATDPYHRPLTIHPTGIGRLSARHATDDTALLDFDMLQTPHGQREAVEPTVNTMRESVADKPVMPVIDGEAAYEMLGDSLPTQWTRQMFWLCMTNGAAGHTYGANGIWQVNRHGHPHGPSPHMPAGSNGYGIIAWDDAMNLPGSSQEAYGKKLFEQFAWQTFQPHPDWVTYASSYGTDIPWGQWIWFAEGSPAQDAPVGKRYFRKSIIVPADGHIGRAELAISADDAFTAFVNGHLVGQRSDWRSPAHLDITTLLKPGRNSVALEAENRPAISGNNPAGLIASVEVRLDSGDKLLTTTDATWLCANDISTQAGWKDPEFTDTTWQPAKELGAYGCAPWGKFTVTTSYGPYATGNDAVRVIYVPVLNPIQVTHLEASAHYHLWYFNPVSGIKTDAGVTTSSADGGFNVGPPAQGDATDWVLVTERAP